MHAFYLFLEAFSGGVFTCSNKCFHLAFLCMGFFSVTFIVHCQFISHLKAKGRYHHMRVTDVGLHHYLAKARNSRWPSDCATCTLAANWPHHSFGHDVIGTPLASHTTHSRACHGKPEGRKKKKKGKKEKKSDTGSKVFFVLRATTRY